MIAQAPANLARLLDGVVSRDARVAASGDKKRCKNAEECGLASAVGAENRQRLSFLNFKRHSGQCHGRGLFKWLEKSAPTAARGGERFRESFDSDRGFGHQERSEEHTSELQSRLHLVCRLLLEKKKN